MTNLQCITSLILDNNTAQARLEIAADSEFSKITGKPRTLNNLQVRDLLEACTVVELS